MTFNINPIGIISSPFKQKFAIPRQPGLAPHAKGQILINKPYDQIEAFNGIEQFSHLWLSFIFHQTYNKPWKPQVKPPRLGGNKKLGVFATRSNFRPNSIGLSVVSFLGLKQSNNQIIIHVGGIDLLDQTPIVDIKPYIPYSDSIEKANAGFASTKPESSLNVVFSSKAQAQFAQLETQYPDLYHLTVEVLSQDPRPAYKKQTQDPKIYTIALYDFDIQWQVTDDLVTVINVKSI